MINSSRVRKITNIIAFGILAIFVVYLVMEWSSIPDIVATHFGASGEANAYGDKESLIIIPVIAVIICAVLAITECFPQVWNFPVEATEENRERLIRDGLIMMGVLKILMAALFSYVGLCTINSWEIAWPMYVLIGALAIDIILGIVRMIKDR